MAALMMTAILTPSKARWKDLLKLSKTKTNDTNAGK